MLFKKVVFLGSKPIGYECFKHLVDFRALLNVEIVGLFTQSRIEFSDQNDLSQYAVENNIPVLTNLDELPECDIIYSVQYHQLLKQEQINKAKQIAVNLHMAPLPEYRGSNQFSFAIIDGKEEFGTTIHKMERGMDNGDILFQKRFPVTNDIWINELYEKTFNASLRLFIQTLPHVVEGKYKLLPQEVLIPKYGSTSHLKKDIEALKSIDLNWAAEKIERHLRATSMPGFEPPYCIINREKVYFTRK